jgi:hypothetical protein
MPDAGACACTSRCHQSRFEASPRDNPRQGFFEKAEVEAVVWLPGASEHAADLG